MRHVVATVTAIRFALSARRDLLVEMLALHHQVAVLARSNRRFRPSDRLLWLVLRRLWPQWRDALMLIQPATVDRWYRDRFDRRWWRRSRRPGRPRINSQYRELIGRLGRGESSLGRAADSRRAAQARHRRLRPHGVAVPAGAAKETVTDLAYIPRESPRQFTCMSHALSPYAPGDDVVDAFARTCRSTRLSNRLSASRQCARIDWPASVRPRCLGLRFTQDHLRERRNMRRSAGRAPPRTGYVQPTHGGHAEGGFVALAPDQLQPLTAGDPCGSPIAIGASIIGTRDRL